MATIKYSALVSEMRNKLNGSVLSKNRGGNYMRNKVTPVNPQTVHQQNQRNLLSTIAKGWRGLTEAQRQAWINASPSFPYTDVYGDKKTLSGSTLYIKLNLNVAKVGGTALDSPPTPGSLGSLTNLVVTAVSATGAVTLGWVSEGGAADQFAFIEATPGIDPGISFVKNRFRAVAYGLLSANTLVLTPQYAARLGAFAVGQKVFARVSVVNGATGQASAGMVSMDIAA